MFVLLGKKYSNAVKSLSRVHDKPDIQASSINNGDPGPLSHGALPTAAPPHPRRALRPSGIKPSSRSTAPKTALSTNLLASPKTAAKKPYRPTSKTSSPRVPRSTFLNTNIAQHLCPSKHFFEHEYCKTFAS